MTKPAIVVVAYNRKRSLKRLLSSLAKAKCPDNTKLIISIDKGKNRGVLQIANNFQWQNGEKNVIYQEENLGLRNHVLKCGDLTQEYGSIILLEDDLFVSPMFYKFATEALDFYKNDERIAGISLYSMANNVLSGFPFRPIIDDSDVFFLQIPESWGEAWNHEQWMNFRAWYSQENTEMMLKRYLPRPVTSWSENSWAKYFWAFMIQKKKFFVFPRESLTTQFGEIGIHSRVKSTTYQVPLQLFGGEYRFKSLDNSIAAYDPYQEILPDRLNRLTKQLRGYDYVVDLNGLKELNRIKAEYCLTSRPCKEHILSFGKEMKPLEMNIIEIVSGHDLFFCRKDLIKQNRRSRIIQWQNDFNYYYVDPPIKRLILLLLLKLFRKKLKS